MIVLENGYDRKKITIYHVMVLKGMFLCSLKKYLSYRGNPNDETRNSHERKKKVHFLPLGGCQGSCGEN